MKKNTLHKVMATALVGAMAMSTLTGCGSSADNTTADAGTKESVAESSAASTDAGASTAVAGIDGWEAFADNVTLQIPVYDRGSSGNGCSDVENNYWTNWVQENFGDKYNITVEYVGITRSDVMTDYAMLAASQSLPTICMEYDYDKLASWQADGYLQTYDVEEFKQIAPTYWETMVEHGNDAYTKLDDEDYLVLGYRPYGNTTYTWCTFYRQDWLEEAGFSEYPVGDNTKLLELYAFHRSAGVIHTAVVAVRTFFVHTFGIRGNHIGRDVAYDVQHLIIRIHRVGIVHRRIIKFVLVPEVALFQFHNALHHRIL